MIARFIALLLSFTLLPSFTVASPKEDVKKGKKGLDALQGKWITIAYAAKRGGQLEPVRPDDDEPWIIKGDKLFYYDSVKRKDIKLIATLKVDPSKKPAHIDFAQKGKWKGKQMEWTTYGIYSLEGNKLTVCVPEKFDPWEPENRPKEFKATGPPEGKGSGFSVYVLEKKK